MDYLKEFRGCQIVASIKHISQSGMARRIVFYAIKDNKLHNITGEIAEVAGYKLKQGELFVGGCGMDMVFSVLSNLNYAMEEIETGKRENYGSYFIDANNYQLI